ncbi:hypothetical protein VTO73DRAFT_15097 [Trametes versicolor]
MNVNPMITPPHPYCTGHLTGLIVVGTDPEETTSSSLEIASALSLLETDKPRTSEQRRYSGWNKLLQAELVRPFPVPRL